MAKEHLGRLSVGELEVLEMLWQHGPVSLSQAHEHWPAAIGYTTIQTRLNRLVAKGVVEKSTERPSQYAAAISREQVSKQDLRVLVDQVNDGEFIPLVAHLVGGRKLTKQELEELKEIVSLAEQKAGTKKQKRSKS